MSNNIDIRVVMDPSKFPNNIGGNISLDTPLAEIPVHNGTEGLWMICESDNVISGNASAYSLRIKAAQGDVIRWWDSPLTVEDKEKDMIVVGFYTSNQQVSPDFTCKTAWENIFAKMEAKDKTIGVATISSGFSLQSLQGLEFGMIAAPQNYIRGSISDAIDSELLGKSIQYYLVVAKLDVSRVGESKLEALYRIDPTITITN